MVEGESEPVLSTIIRIALIVILTIILLGGLYFLLRNMWGLI